MVTWSEILGNDWLESIAASSVPLWKYDKNQFPLANASGCMVDYAGERFLISIAHASIATDEWTFEVKTVDVYNGEVCTCIQPINMQFLTQFNLGENENQLTEPKIVDFTYRKIPKDLFSIQSIRFADGTLISAQRSVFVPDLEIKPSIEKKYGFFGQVRFNGVIGKRIVFENRLEHDLAYTGRDGDFYVFKLSHPYGSHNGYKGCSGAPIIDEDGNLVCLVSFGKKSTNSIYGIDIHKYMAALQIEANPPPKQKI